MAAITLKDLEGKTIERIMEMHGDIGIEFTDGTRVSLSIRHSTCGYGTCHYTDVDVYEL
jgi:hypothetical protein